MLCLGVHFTRTLIFPYFLQMHFKAFLLVCELAYQYADEIREAMTISRGLEYLGKTHNL